jgi:hypothetical protein
MIPEHLKQTGITPEEWEDIKQFIAQVLKPAAEQGVTCCFEKSNGKMFCDFSNELCCRTCNSADVERREVFVGNPMFWPVWKTEPSEDDIMVSYYCDVCERLTMVSHAQHCAKCGVCLFALSEDEGILAPQTKMTNSKCEAMP